MEGKTARRRVKASLGREGRWDVPADEEAELFMVCGCSWCGVHPSVA